MNKLQNPAKFAHRTGERLKNFSDLVQYHQTAGYYINAMLDQFSNAETCRIIRTWQVAYDLHFDTHILSLSVYARFTNQCRDYILDQVRNKIPFEPYPLEK